MILNKNEITRHLNTKGYIVIKDFINNTDISVNFLNYIKKKDKFVDGVVHGLDKKYYSKIDKKIKILAKLLKSKNLNISDKKFGYTSIRIKKTKNTKSKLIKPFNFHKDPKVMPGGVLNWHIDHFMYWFSCYDPTGAGKHSADKI